MWLAGSGVQGSLRQGSYSEEAGACLEGPTSSRAREDTSIPTDQPSEVWLLGASLRLLAWYWRQALGRHRFQPGHRAFV